MRLGSSTEWVGCENERTETARGEKLAGSALRSTSGKPGKTVTHADARGRKRFEQLEEKGGKMAEVVVTATIDLDELDDDEIRSEYERRLLAAGLEKYINDMYEAFALQQEDRAIEIARRIAEDITGRSIA